VVLQLGRPKRTVPLRMTSEPSARAGWTADYLVLRHHARTFRGRRAVRRSIRQSLAEREGGQPEPVCHERHCKRPRRPAPEQLDGQKEEQHLGTPQDVCCPQEWRELQDQVVVHFYSRQVQHDPHPAEEALWSSRSPAPGAQLPTDLSSAI
jgi:hypothetical protein